MQKLISNLVLGSVVGQQVVHVALNLTAGYPCDDVANFFK
jgi:hypothetical protein